MADPTRKSYLGPRGTTELTRLIKLELAEKQDVVRGYPGDIPTFDDDGNLMASSEIRELYELLKQV